MFVWGDSTIGCYYRHGRNILSPTGLPDEYTDSIKVLAGGQYHCCVLSTDGTVTVFCNDDATNNISKSEKMTSLNELNITNLFSGGHHMFAVTDDGSAFGWGRNNHGQLGWKDGSESYVGIPKVVPLPPDKQVVQISCGVSHTLVLLDNGSIYSFGDNSYGQLGIGTFEPTLEPTNISLLNGVPVARITACGWHSFCVTVSGRIFCWGRNDFGQLGLGDQNHHNVPCPLHMPKSLAVKFVAGGDYHSALLTHDGQLFTFGSSSKGQLGNGGVLESVVVPVRVSELIGSVVTQVACGKRHTMAYVPDSANIFAWGDGEKGQLGLDELEYLNAPVIVDGPWRSSESVCKIKQIYACGNQCCAITGEPLVDFRNQASHRQPCSIDKSHCHHISKMSQSRQIPSALIQWLKCAMSSQSCFNSSFLENANDTTSDDCANVDLPLARKLFSMLMEQKNKHVIEIIKSNLTQFLLPSLHPNPRDVEALRLYLIIPEFEIFHIPDYHDSLLLPFVEKFLNLDEGPSRTLDKWYRSLTSDSFIIPIQICQGCIVSTLKRSLASDVETEKISLLLNFLQKLYDVNHAENIVGFKKFYIPQLSKLMPLQRTISENQYRNFSSYPFVYDLIAKYDLFKRDAEIERDEWYRQACEHNENPFLVITVHRQRPLVDAICAIRDEKYFKRPIYVKFDGEEGQDYGGLCKEFFMVVFQDVAKPEFKMFVANEDSHLLWFSDGNLVPGDRYYLIGTLFGLSLYHSATIDIDFPLALYKKLLGVKPTLADLKELQPNVARILQELADEEDSSIVEDKYMLDFTINASTELIENGKYIPVTGKNRSEYIIAYLDYVFHKSVESQFECFKSGFLRVCGGKMLNFFRPEELMDLFAGDPNYDWKELQKVTDYDGGYFKKDKVIHWFWEVFHSLTRNDKREFVRFLTGSSIIPTNGLKLTIRPKMKDTDDDINDYLPVAHTCFYILDLPRYTRKGALESKLKLAIKTDGFYVA